MSKDCLFLAPALLYCYGVITYVYSVLHEFLLYYIELCIIVLQDGACMARGSSATVYLSVHIAVRVPQESKLLSKTQL